MLTQQQGSELIKIAKEAIKADLEKDSLLEEKLKKKIKEKIFEEKRGVFVTIKKNGKLRGCVGFPYPILPLGEAIIKAAKAAAFSDFRFPPLEKNEFDKIRIEISVLTKPEEILDKDITKIEIGKDGLIISFRGCSGLLLPQVAVEQKWNKKEFLEQTCIKAGLHPETYKEEECKIYKFRAEIFSEKT